MSRLFFTLVLLTALLGCTLSLSAQEAKLVSTTTVVNLTHPDTSAVLKSQSGDTLLIRLTYTNEGTGPAEKAAITSPINEAYRLLPKSWTTKECTALFSQDKEAKTFAPFPLKSEVVDEKGKKVQKETPLESYTFLQFKPRKPIQPKAKMVFEYKVIVR